MNKPGTREEIAARCKHDGLFDGPYYNDSFNELYVVCPECGEKFVLQLARMCPHAEDY